MKTQVFLFFVFLIFVSCTSKKYELRETINLNGNWDIEESSTINLPENYTHTCVVLGLVDMAVPSFDSVGVKYTKRNFYNYHRTIELPHDLPSLVLTYLRNREII